MDTSVLDRPPDAEWGEAEATYIVNGVEFVDPDGALEGVELSVQRVAGSSLATSPADATDLWSIEPSMVLSSIVYVRFPLESPRVPGEELELYTMESDESAWWAQSVGVVTDDGARAMFGMVHFSKQATVTRNNNRKAFVDGTYCDGETAVGTPLTVGQHLPATSEVDTVGALSADRPTHATMAERLTHLGGIAELADRLLFKNEENVGPASTGCESAKGEPGHENEDEYGDPALGTPLRRLADRVRERSCGTLKLMVTETFDTGSAKKPKGEHAANSLHYEGRAVDLVLVGTKPDGKVDCNVHRYPPGYGRLGQIAAEQDGSVLAPAAGFEWVWYESPTSDRINDHVHASVTSATVTPPPDSFAPNTFSATVTIGSETIDYVSDVMERRSNGFDNLIMESTEFIDGSWMTITLIAPDAGANGTFELEPELGPNHVAVRFSRADVALDSGAVMVPMGTVTFEQVPAAERNYLTVTSGEFAAELSDGEVDARIEGSFSVDDLRFWEL